MVIDDEYDIVHVIRRTLTKWGYDVDTYTNPLHAFDVFKANPTRYSLVITDIRMPEVDGVTLSAMMRKIRPNMNIIIMSAFEIAADDLKSRLPTIQSGDIMIKPFTMHDICDNVKQHLQTA